MITLPNLPYPYDSLEPYIDEKTMRIHHSKHHQAYIDKLNSVLDIYPQLQTVPIEQLLSSLEKLPIEEKDKIILRNHGGGHVNHTFFWTIMGNKKAVHQDLVKKIIKTYGSIKTFQDLFTTAALAHFGSGWAWLVEKKNKQLDVSTTHNQDSPYLTKDTPLIGLDLWEHAYYLTYQNRKKEYIANWWNVLTII